MRRLTVLILLASPLFAAAWLLSVAWRVDATGRRDDARPADAVVVLGAAQYHGWPSLIYRTRLDHALALYREGRAPLVVLVGGRQPGDAFTEAEAGARYLRSRGVPSGALLAVGEGENTLTSLEAAAEVARGRGLEDVLVVSDRFHMFRSLRMAADLGLRAYGSPTPTSPVEVRPLSRFRYTVREVAAYAAYTLPRLAGAPHLDGRSAAMERRTGMSALLTSAPRSGADIPVCESAAADGDAGTA